MMDREKRRAQLERRANEQNTRRKAQRERIKQLEAEIKLEEWLRDLDDRKIAENMRDPGRPSNWLTELAVRKRYGGGE